MRRIESLAMSVNIAGGILAVIFVNPPVYLLTCCTITFLCYGADKYGAIHNSSRFSERFLITLAIIGGAIPALVTMILFHHKINKPLFLLFITGLSILQLILIGVFV